MTKTEIIQHKILDAVNLDRFVARCRLLSKKIVFTNGCFDIMHRGHLEYLSAAADMGDVFIVGLNTDSSTKLLKGSSRPIVDEQSRAIQLASLFFVDAVVLFHQETPQQLIDKILPDVLVKGGDYKPREIVGYNTVTKNGGSVETIDFVEGFSTTSLIEKIKKAY
ncbi:MAG: D-glycero-beta-D-manno-heptose 1-phosphate adenylyltransferase [Bacteroidales bacterium]|nr:D-glycero-beta-D-manno-heptose 1-phosphate adenylyltransferase [Bacteroidales bacterium]